MHKYKNQIYKQFKRFDARLSNILSVNLNSVRFPFMWSSAMTDNTISSFSFHIKTFVKYLARVATHKHAYVCIHLLYRHSSTCTQINRSNNFSESDIYRQEKTSRKKFLFLFDNIHGLHRIEIEMWYIAPLVNNFVFSQALQRSLGLSAYRASSCVNSNRKSKATRNRNKNIQMKYSWINSAIIVDSCFIYSPHDFIDHLAYVPITNPENNAAWPLTTLSSIILISTSFYFSYIWNRLCIHPLGLWDDTLLK